MSTLAAGVSYVLQPHLHSEQKTSGALQRARQIYKGTNADVYRIGALTGEVISSDDEDLDPPTFKTSLSEKSEKAPTQTVTQVRNLLALGHKSYSSVTEPGLEILIPDLVTYGNDYNLAPSQLKRILDHHLRGTLKQTADTIIKTAGILRGIEKLGKLFYRPQIRQNYAENIRNWKLNTTKPVLPQLQELEVWYMTGHKQNKSAQEIELLTKEAALRGVSLGVKAFMDATESHYRYMHSNKSIPIHTFAKRMERALDGSKAIPAARVRSIETNHPSDDVRLNPPQEPIPASHDLRGLTQQMERMSSQLSTLQPVPVNTRSLELNHLTNSVTKMSQEIAAIRKVTSNLPSVNQMSQEIAAIRNVTSNLPVVNNPKTNYQTNEPLRPIIPGTRQFREAINENTMNAFNQKGSKDEDTKTYYWTDKGLYRPLMPIWQVPKNITAFVDKFGKPRITPALLRHFEGLCVFCGLPHRQQGKSCIYKGKAANWTICRRCKTGLHTEEDCCLDLSIFNEPNKSHSEN
jgi:hypothetical protein